ncbi:MAG: aldo/keto reductase [Deltaproteobacteria bacterium]|nr:MAG: aldo/keto reductase [Deltaproteobacteria bacterium]
MKYVPLGGTGMKVSRLCLGCMSYGSPSWRPWVLDEAGAAPFFRRAVEAGINFFDTADMYSLGESEVVFMPANDRPNMGGLSRKHIQQGCEASLRRLGVDVIDLYQIHRLDPETPIEETLAALDLLVRQGKVRAIGASTMYAWEFARALAISDREGFARFATMQNHYNLIYREEEREMMPLCEFEGVAVIPWSPLARGLLAGTRQKLGDDSTTRSATDGLDKFLYDQPSDWDVVEAVRAVAKQRGVAPAQVALAWLCSRPAVAAPILGATKLGHLEDGLSALELELEAEEIAALEAPYRPHSVKGIAPKSSMRRR